MVKPTIGHLEEVMLPQTTNNCSVQNYIKDQPNLGLSSNWENYEYNSGEFTCTRTYLTKKNYKKQKKTLIENDFI